MYMWVQGEGGEVHATCHMAQMRLTSVRCVSLAVAFTVPCLSSLALVRADEAVSKALKGRASSELREYRHPSQPQMKDDFECFYQVSKAIMIDAGDEQWP